MPINNGRIDLQLLRTHPGATSIRFHSHVIKYGYHQT